MNVPKLNCLYHTCTTITYIPGHKNKKKTNYSISREKQQQQQQQQQQHVLHPH